MALRLPPTLLIVEPDAGVQNLLRECLASGETMELAFCVSESEAITLLGQKHASVVLSSLTESRRQTSAVLEYVKRARVPTVVILASSFGCVEGAVQAIRDGAFDYLTLPYRVEELRGVVRRAFRQADYLEKAVIRLCSPENESREAERLLADTLPRVLVGRSRQMVDVYKKVARAGLCSSNVLILGESGTGKELVARGIHDNSARKSKRFVAVNCGALPDALLESELFGYVRGAFTGALQDRKGLFEEADGGTLFLDEIGDVSPTFQVKLLRFIQDGEFKPLGSSQSRRANVRIIAATHRDLSRMLANDTFRRDLYYRLNVIRVELPALRYRMEDLADLVSHFLVRFAERNEKRIDSVSPEAMTLLLNHSWPGNLRELENAIDYAVSMAQESVLYPEDFPEEIVNQGQDRLASMSGCEGGSDRVGSPILKLEELEREHILRTLRAVSFNKTKAADILGIDRVTLYRKAQRYRIPLN